jgi:lipopolysaccharide/colanic/teichoic acid biosynthesis glycosyltransferase
MYKNIFKRLIDILVSFFGLIVLSPLFVLLIIILHFANDGAGVFFTQLRPGKNEKIFKLIKFKSMNDKKDENGNLLPNEERITKVGQFIRNSSLDELPQLLNVIKGDMSLVGPRPFMIRYLDLYNQQQKRRHDVRPGSTGWAQVNGRNNISWTKKFELDVYYVDNLTIWFDIKIIILTIYKVLRKSNINSKDNIIGANGFDGKN